MANCNSLFAEFNNRIKLEQSRRVNLREKRNILREHIYDGFSKIEKVRRINDSLTVTMDEIIEFQSQGSYVMDTIITPCRDEDEYDLDDGVYFYGKRSAKDRPSPTDFHTFILESISKGKGKDDITEVKDKETCVRVRYNGKKDYNYHIDIPIYYVTNPLAPELADTKDGWIVSSPVEFIKWFEDLVNSGFRSEFILERRLYKDQYQHWLDDRRKKDHQLRRIVRYLKAWGDNLQGDMPPGVVMTILAGSNSNYSPNERDDVSLRDTLINIQKWLSINGFTCPRPTTPKNVDLFKNYSETKKQYFNSVLSTFVNSAKQAVESDNPKDACSKWQRHLGSRFPCELAKDEIENANVYSTATIIKSDNSKSA
ncbi:MAG TPA: hypothetical protein VL443_25030 [Cyclobacteriaceae bacterium]|jgi:hypothetical protein|nr:hypothetical protein [Cyclobacteriaceae bacterium]